MENCSSDRKGITQKEFFTIMSRQQYEINNQMKRCGTNEEVRNKYM